MHNLSKKVHKNNNFSSNPDDSEEEKAHKRRAFNIENIVQSVDIMEDRIDNQFGLTNARISF